VLLHEIYGVNATMRAAADQFADEGYVALVPDLFWRIQPGIDLGFDPASSQKALEYLGRFDFDLGVRDVQAALQALQARPEHQGKTGVIGFCMGGLVAYLAAARLPFDVAVVLYGGRIEQHLAEAGNIRCPILFHFGVQDPLIPPAAVAQIRAAFAGRSQAKVYDYPDVGHGFYLVGRPSLHPLSSQLAHSRTIALLRRVLGPHYDLEALWDQHLDWEFAKVSAEGALTTMTPHPVNLNVPVQTGGNGYDGVLHYYKY
jgi:carboxymethylenebutenolidase